MLYTILHMVTRGTMNAATLTTCLASPLHPAAHWHANNSPCLAATYPATQWHTLPLHRPSSTCVPCHVPGGFISGRRVRGREGLSCLCGGQYHSRCSIFIPGMVLPYARLTSRLMPTHHFAPLLFCAHALAPCLVGFVILRLPGKRRLTIHTHSIRLWLEERERKWEPGERGN